jgi:hypothetical protein
LGTSSYLVRTAPNREPNLGADRRSEGVDPDPLQVDPWDLGALLSLAMLVWSDLSLSVQIPLILLLLRLQHTDLGMHRRLQSAAKWHCRAQLGTALTHSTSPASQPRWSHNAHRRWPLIRYHSLTPRQQSLYSWHLLLAHLCFS